jgi:hypothetical protein
LQKTEAWLQQLHHKYLQRLAQETTVLKQTMRTATKLLKLCSYTTAVNSLQPCDSIARPNFCNWYLQSVEMLLSNQYTQKRTQRNQSPWSVTYIQRTITAREPESVYRVWTMHLNKLGTFSTSYAM